VNRSPGSVLRVRVPAGALVIAALAVMLFLVPSASAASVQLGQLAPANTDGGCDACTNLQVETVSPAPSYEVPGGDWSLTSWSAQGGLKGGSVKLRIFRPTAIPGQFRLVAETPLETIAPATIATFPAEIPVEPGDRLGLETGPGTGGPNYYPSTYSAPLGNRQDGVVGAPKVGQTVGTGGEFEVGNSGGRLLNIAATLSTPTASLGVNSNGGGSIIDPAAGIDCAEPSCAYRFDVGTALTLEAVPAPGHTFTGWSGGCSGLTSCSLGLAADVSVSASFAAVPSTGSPGTAAPTTSLRLGKLKHNRGKGTAIVSAQVSGPGSLTLTGKGIVKAEGGSLGVGVVKLPVVATGAAKRLLARTGKAKVLAAVVFAPGGGGTAVRVTKEITLKRSVSTKAPRSRSR
jgi:hypothetical protein